MGMNHSPITCCQCGRDTRLLIGGVCHHCATARVVPVPADDPKPGDPSPRRDLEVLAAWRRKRARLTLL